MSTTYTQIVIAGCGNPLYGDDGFGPAVAEELRKIPLPDHVMAIDAGMSAPEFMFPLLDPEETKTIIIIDIVDSGAEPGTLVLIRPGNNYRQRIRDAHEGGIMGSLHTIREGIGILIIGCQPACITDPVLEIGLSEIVRNAIPPVIRFLTGLIGEDIPVSDDRLSGLFRKTLHCPVAAGTGTFLKSPEIKRPEIPAGNL